MQIIGLDIGHRAVKGTDGQKDVLLSSVAMPVAVAPTNLSGKSEGQIVDVDGEKWIAGIDPDSVSDWSPAFGPKFIESNAWLALARHSLSQWQHDKVAVAIGLPSDLYGMSDLRTSARSRLKGVHHVAGRSIEVANVAVIEQPCGTARAFLDTPAGKGMAGAVLCIADVGGGTVDARLVQDDKAFPDVGGSLRPSMIALCQGMVGRVAAKINVASVAPGLVERAMRNNGMLSHFGEEIDISDIIKDGADEMAGRVARWLDGMLQGTSAQGVLLTGGGAEVLFEPLKDRLPKIVKMDDALMANARGFQKILLEAMPVEVPPSDAGLQRVS